MGDAAEPYLFDVGVIALAHTEAPGCESALSYVHNAIAGDIDALCRIRRYSAHTPS